MECIVVASSCSVKIVSGWRKFAKGNNLKAGDACVFELVNRKPIEFNITIFRIAVEEDVVKTKKASAKKETTKPKAMKRLLKRVESFKSENPHFRVFMNSTYIHRVSVTVPSAHAKIYLKEDEPGENVITLYGVNGRSWKVEYYHRFRLPNSSAKKVLLSKGWMDFVGDNHLQEGDCIIFERMSGKAKAYKVTIFSLGDHAWCMRATKLLLQL